MSTHAEVADVQAILESLEARLGELAGKVRAGAGLEEVERELHQSLLDTGRTALRWLTGAAGDGDVGPELVAAGERYRRRRPAPLPLRTSFGTVELSRYVYVSAAGDCLYPLDAQLELSQKQVSPFLQQRLVRMGAKDAFGGVRDDLREDLHLSMSGRTIQEVMRYRAQDAREFRSQTVPKQVAPGRLLVVNFDGKGIPVLKSEQERNPWKNLLPGEKPNKRRMAMLATIHEQDPVEHDVEAIVSRERSSRDAASPRPAVENREVIADLEDRVHVFREVRRQIEARLGPDTLLVIGSDGDRSQLALIAKHFGDLDPLVLLDWYHASTYLWGAALALQPADPEEYFERQARRMLAGNTATVIRGMRQSLTKRRKKGLSAVAKAIRYFENHLDVMAYDIAIAEGAPIGTGSVEGACGHVVRARMERPGMRWSVEGAQAVLLLRCIQVSGLAAAHDAWFREREIKRLHGWRQNVSQQETRGRGAV